MKCIVHILKGLTKPWDLFNICILCFSFRWLNNCIRRYKMRCHLPSLLMAYCLSLWSPSVSLVYFLSLSFKQLLISRKGLGLSEKFFERTLKLFVLDETNVCWIFFFFYISLKQRCFFLFLLRAPNLLCPYECVNIHSWIEFYSYLNRFNISFWFISEYIFIMVEAQFSIYKNPNPLHRKKCKR